MIYNRLMTRSEQVQHSGRNEHLAERWSAPYGSQSSDEEKA